MNLLEIALVGIVTTFSNLIIWHRLLKKKIDFKSLRLYITQICLSVICLVNYFNINVFLRIISITIILMVFFKFLFKENLQKSVITPIFSQIVIMISELIFGLIISLILGYGSQDIVNTQFARIFSNFSIAVLNVLIVLIPTTPKIYDFLLKITDKLSKRFLIILALFSLIVANILAGTLYYKINYLYLLIFNTSITIICLLIVIYTYSTQNKYNKVNDKFNTTLNSLKEYENILDEYRISNHENKNQLLTIRNMIKDKDKKSLTYIDKIIENKTKDDYKIMSLFSKIPSGGLRGLIYSKVLVMKENNIKYTLDISNNISTVDLINIEDNLLLDICKVIGVYLDNSIEAVKDLEDKYVSLGMYIQDSNLVISISNNYEGFLNIDKIEEKGYTTKGRGHGYGLILAKEIIENNKKLSNEKNISKDVFSQKLIVKL